MKHIALALAVAVGLVVVGGVPSARDALAAGKESIVAVVNQGVVTASDLDARLDLIAASTGLPPSKELSEKLRPQVIDMLVEEQIKMQEAKRLSITVDDKDIDAGFNQIAAQNKIEPDVFRKALQQRGIKLSTMQDQIRAQLAWTKVVQKRVRPRVDVSEADVDSELDFLKANLGKDQYKIAEIFLPTGDAAKNADVRTLASKLSDQLKKTPEAFPKVARQFSQSAGADQGGLVGWVYGGQLSEEVDKVLPTLGNGQVSAPIDTPSGIYIILLIEKRVLSAETLPSREDIMQRIGNQRLDRAQQRYLMDLFSSSFIEKRV